jgi:hypothetical protein
MFSTIIGKERHMKRARTLITTVVFLLLVLAPGTAAGAYNCSGEDPAAVAAYQLATLQAEGQIVILNTTQTLELDAFNRATLQAEGQVMVSTVTTTADDLGAAVAAYELAVLQAEGQVVVDVLVASCES